MNELAELRQQVEELRRQLADARELVSALTRREIDTVATDGMATPLLLHDAQAKLRTSEKLLRGVFDGALDAMLLADDTGTYVDANPSACDLFGVRPEALIGRRLADFAAPRWEGDAAYKRFCDGVQSRGQFALPRADGTSRVLDYSAAPSVAPGLHLSVLRDVTERIATENALRRSEALFRVVIEKSADAISLTGLDGATRYLTPSLSRILGWTADELGGEVPRDLVVPEDRSHLESELARLVRSGERDMSLEFRVKHRDGSTRWMEMTGTNLLDDPNVGAIVGHYREITARKHAEEAVRESVALLEEAQAIAHVGSWTAMLGPDDELTWSRECYRIFGIPERTIINMESFVACIHPAEREVAQRALRDAIEHDAPANLECRVVWPAGEVRWIHARGTVVRDVAAGTRRIIGTVQDITDRQAAIDALKSSEERYRRIIETTSEGVWLSDATLTTTFVNEPMANMLGFTRDEMVGRPALTFVADEGIEIARAKFGRRFKGVAETYENSYRRKDGSILWALAKTNPVFDENGQFAGTIALLSDRTAERKFEEARNRLAAIVESSEDAIISVLPPGEITSWNLAAERLYQYRPDEVLGKSIFVLVPAPILDHERHVLERAALGDAALQYETRRSRKDGSVIEVAVTASPVRDARGTVIAISMVFRDLTERRKVETALRRSEEQLRQAQKMEAIGSLAGGVAHDFNNLLSVILSYTSLTMDDLRPDDPIRADLAEVHKAGVRAAELTRQLLAFSRQQVLNPSVVSLNPIVAGIEKMLARLLGESVDFSLLLSDNLGRVHADPGQLEQVLMNLIVNARDAMPLGGSLTIETSNAELDAEEAANCGVERGAFVMLAVTDSGEGMSRATLDRIFEPFFTTKEKGKGTGLGLATVYGIVHQSGGHIRVDSELGKGTTFRVYLPRTDRPVSVQRSIAPKISKFRGSETVLIVEDEEQVRAIMRTVLRKNGYHVLEAQNGGEAFLICEKFGSTIDLLLTDVVMPRMSGRELANRVTLLRPDMKVLYVSGYTDELIEPHGVLDAGLSFLQKPITPTSLLSRVRDLLDAPEAISPAAC